MKEKETWPLSYPYITLQKYKAREKKNFDCHTWNVDVIDFFEFWNFRHCYLSIYFEWISRELLNNDP